MIESALPYWHAKGVLSDGDIAELISVCREQLETMAIPCYALINRMESAVFVKLKQFLEKATGEPLYYLNDFYIYTDKSFKTEWHVDTELFTFERALNAWILLSPSYVEDPLGFLSPIDDETEFHHVKLDNGSYLFEEYCFGKEIRKPKESIEAGAIHTPGIRLGDVLVFDPRRFHRTNITTAKHALSIKFVRKGSAGFLSSTQVDPFFWPEVGLFNKLVKSATTWDDVMAGIRASLADDQARRKLSAGFYPEQFALYKTNIRTL